MLPYEPRHPTFRGAEWDLTPHGVDLIKPCGCKVSLVARESLTRHDVGYCPFSGQETAYLLKEVARVRDEDGFNHRFRRRWHAKQARHSWLCVLELSDRLERETEVGPYLPATLELMRNLAQEIRIEHAPSYGYEFTCVNCGMEIPKGGCCPGCIEGKRHIEQEMLLAPRKERTYEIVVEDNEYGHRSREEMLMDIGRNSGKSNTSRPLSSDD